MIWHYTKGTKLDSIWAKNAIATEQTFKESEESGMPQKVRDIELKIGVKFDFVWATTETEYPLTAYPGFMEPSGKKLKLNKHMVDFALTKVHGFFRFGFPDNDERFELWVATPEYKQRRTGLAKKYFNLLMDTAKKGGDNISQWYISRNHVGLMSLGESNFPVPVFEFLVPGTNGKRWELVSNSEAVGKELDLARKLSAGTKSPKH